MQPLKFNCLSFLPWATWPRILVQYLGRAWSLCSTALNSVIRRISIAAQDRFFPKVDAKPAPSQPGSLILSGLNQGKPAEKEPSAEERTEEFQEDEGFALFEQDNHTADHSDGKKNATPNAKEELKESLSTLDQTGLAKDNKTPENARKLPQQIADHEILDDDMLKKQNDTLKGDLPDQTALASDKKTPTGMHKSPPQIADDKKVDPNNPQPVNVLPIEKDPPLRRNVRRARYKNRGISLEEYLNPNSPEKRTSTVNPPFQPQPTTIPIATAKPLPAKPQPSSLKPKPYFIECGGGGNCQLLSLSKGLEMLHPQIGKVEANKKLIPYTALDLRQMGVKFARDQIDQCGRYANEILGYLDTDRKEHNESVLEAMQKARQGEEEALEKALKEKKILPDNYEKQKNALDQKYQKRTDLLKQSMHIQTDAEFLNRLEKNGFSCSTLHVYALSALLEVPILVHEQDGIPGHDIQTFNPADSKLQEIHLCRVGKNHYKLMVIP